MDRFCVDDTNELFPDTPLCVYGGRIRDSLEIKENSVVIRNDAMSPCWYQEYEFRFEELTDVYFKASADLYTGYLSIRGRFNQWMPVPTSRRGTRRDMTTVIFSTDHSYAFRKVYEFLQKCIEINRENPKVLQKPSVQPPIGVYKGVMGQLDMTEDCVIFTKKMPGYTRTCCTVTYKDLWDVSLEKPTFWTNGELRVRCWQNRKIPMTHPSALETNLVFTKKHRAEFEKIYEFLKMCCKKTEE